MSLRCGIIGITNSGKTTLFNCVSSTRAESTRFAFSSSRSNIGMAPVPDPRLDRLLTLQPTEKVTPVTVELVDIPGLARGSGAGEGVGSKFLADIRNTDALIHVLRCFDDPALPHVEGTVNPVRDMETVDLELQAKDMESVVRKLERLEKTAKAGDKQAKKGVEVLEQLRDHLDALRPARSFEISAEDYRYFADMFLLSAKPVMYVCNVDETSLKEPNVHVHRVMDALKGQETEILVIGAKLEAEIAELDDPAERMEYLRDAGLSEPGVNRLIRSAYRLLDLRTFFTVGPQEIRAWTLKAGMNAQQAAGVIHSDLERGFIRAEVMKYDDFVTLGSESACRDAGKLHLQGKNYIVEDGDILHIRFNV